MRLREVMLGVVVLMELSRARGCGGGGLTGLPLREEGVVVCAGALSAPSCVTFHRGLGLP